MIEFAAGIGPNLALDPTSVLDIGALVVAGVDIAPKRAVPDDGDPRIDHSLEGFLFTCGPDHIRHPEPIGVSEETFYPLHGSASSNAASIKSLEKTDAGAECLASIPVRNADGSEALIERSWAMDGVTGLVTLRDRVINVGDRPFPVMMMYHINFGARHFDDGVALADVALAEGGKSPDGVLPWHFGEGEHGIFCVPAVAGPDGWSKTVLGPIAALGGRSFILEVDTASLPFLQIWRNQERPAHILGIEPASHRWAPRRELAGSGELEALAPGAEKEFSLRFRFA
ncbi:DUF4432 family protein [Martelella alba]|uniref:DUF4432 family protein n=1 Tax=Martelella alba TaxID=2590451 RepID=A0A506U5U8_9HYPH|nr:DUF4432 family protein [Martelella alba]TPW29752.1 DUF4432 family protein [Martelella alba]